MSKPTAIVMPDLIRDPESQQGLIRSCFDWPDFKILLFRVMAIWQFTFDLVPKAGILKVHDSIPKIIPAFETRLSPEMDEEDEDPNYWQNEDARHYARLFEHLLPSLKSWSEDAIMFGDHETHDIKIWNDTLQVRFDLRSLTESLMRGVIEIAKSNDWVLVLAESAEVIEPEWDILTEKIKASRAARFVVNPHKTLQEFL